MDLSVTADAALGPAPGHTVGRVERYLGLDGVDAFGIVYFSRYWDWYQHAFEILLEELGHPLRGLIDEGLGMPVVHADIDYRRALLLGERVTCEVWPVAAGRSSLRMAGRFTDVDGELLAVAGTVHVVTAKDALKSTEMPVWLREAVGS